MGLPNSEGGKPIMLNLKSWKTKGGQTQGKAMGFECLGSV
jgi:hypothetical protein